MCLGIPGRIVELLDNPHLAHADVFGVVRTINVGLIEDGVEPGDWVLLHIGFAMNKLNPAEVERAKASLDLLGAGPEEGTTSALEQELNELLAQPGLRGRNAERGG